jgi:MFS family permease
MVTVSALLRRNRDARFLIAARGLSATGTGAAYVALMLIAYDRTHSAWIVSAVLAADLLPSIAAGSIAGALADRWPRRRLIVMSEAAGATAFAGLALTSGTPALLLFALAAGAAGTIGMTAQLAYLPDLVSEPGDVVAANGGFAAVSEGGTTAGMGLAAAALLVVGTDGLLVANAASFAAAAVLIARTRPPAARTAATSSESILRTTRDGIRLCFRSPVLRRALISSAAASGFLALVNVGEVVLARGALHGGQTAYSLLVAVFGAGVALGALAAARAFPDDAAGGFRAGLLLAALGLGSSAAAPNVGVALVSFAVSGLAGGFLMVHGRQLLNELAPADTLGLAFGLRDQLGACAFGAAFLVAPVLIGSVGVRGLFLISATGALAVGTWLVNSETRSRDVERNAHALRALVVDDRSDIGLAKEV